MTVDLDAIERRLGGVLDLRTVLKDRRDLLREARRLRARIRELESACKHYYEDILVLAVDYDTNTCQICGATL